MEHATVDASNEGIRLDVFLAQHPSISSRTEAKRLISEGQVKINDSIDKITPKVKVSAGDIISFKVIPKPDYDFTPTPYDLDIVHEDDHLIIINKPAGMVVHPAPGHYRDTLVNYLLHHTNLSDQNTERPGIVHRIDKDTSGLLVVAKTNAAHENLADQFFHHSVSRIYQAIVWGTPDLPFGKIDEPIGRDPNNRKRFKVKPEGKDAITNWKVLASYRYLSLVQCRLETGRTHQIRVHMSFLGHPLLGDQVYGRYREFGPKIPTPIKNELKRYAGQALHAKTLGFIHPDTNQKVSFNSDLPDQMVQIIDLLESLCEE